MIGVYVIKHIESGRLYVGASGDVHRRIDQHFRAANWAVAQFLHRAIQKHGAAAFSWELLEECSTEEQALAREMHWIAVLRTKAPEGFNLTDGGDGVRGRIITDESRRRMSESHIGKKHRESTKLRMSEAHKKRFEVNPELKNRIRGRHTMPHTEESKRRISEAKKAYYARLREQASGG